MLLNNISKQALKVLNTDSFNYNDYWEYTDIKKVKKIFNHSNPINNDKQSQSLDEFPSFGNIKNHILIFNNSKIKNNLLNSDIIVNNISSAFKNNQLNCKKTFNKIIPNNKNEFILSNTAYFKKGFFLYVNDNAIIDNPIQINNIINSYSSNNLLNSRYLLHFGKNIKAQVIIKDCFMNNMNINNLIEINIDKNSSVDIVIDSEKKKNNQIMNLSANIKNDSQLNIYAIDISGELVRNNYYINLEYQNSTFNYSGISLLKANNHIDNFVEINHKNKNTFSASNQKNILRENSKSIFYSKSTIDKKSSNAEAQQNNKNMLLSKKATVHSNPQLEIYNNDVKCSHGSTTGELDEDMLFYLRTRGLSLNKAKKMLLEGFLNEFIDSIGNNEATKNLKNKINDWL